MGQAPRITGRCQCYDLATLAHTSDATEKGQVRYRTD
jgi:hypothetical protein